MGKSIFKNEREMQDWLCDCLNNIYGLSELIINLDDFTNFNPETAIEEKIKDSFIYCIDSLHITHLVTEDENISLDEKESLNPDFLLYAPETDSVVFVELKNQKNATREAGTELSAYISEVKSQLPFLSEGEIVRVIISPEWPVLLRHYVINEIFWLGRKVICLEPFDYNGTTQLRIIDIHSLTKDNIELKFCNQHFGGYHICMYDYNVYDKNRFDKYLEQMRTALAIMANKGESQLSHGFAFLWKDTGSSLTPYIITLLNVASFNLIERAFHDENYYPPEITRKFIEIIKEYNPEGHGKSLDEISKSGEKYLRVFCSPRSEVFSTWDDLKDAIDRRANPLIAFSSWGIIRELYEKKLINSYLEGKIDTKIDDPSLGLELVNELIDPDYEFIDLAHCYIDDEEKEIIYNVIDEYEVIFGERENVEYDFNESEYQSYMDSNPSLYLGTSNIDKTGDLPE